MLFNEVRHHTVISGTGRAGTSFLVHLLTELGLDTGFRPGEIPDAGGYHNPAVRAGLEHDIRRNRCPYIVKSPGLCDHIDEVAQRRDIVIDHALIPVRALDDAAASRIRVQLQRPIWRPNKANGGLWDAVSLDHQRQVLAEKQHRLILHLAEMDVPMTFLVFPRLVLDSAYAHDRLSRALDLGVDRAKFDAVFAAVARPDRVSDLGDLVAPAPLRTAAG